VKNGQRQMFGEGRQKRLAKFGRLSMVLDLSIGYVGRRNFL